MNMHWLASINQHTAGPGTVAQWFDSLSHRGGLCSDDINVIQTTAGNKVGSDVNHLW